MDIVYISLCFIALFTFSLGLDPLEVRFENASRVDAVEGAEVIHFRCHLNRGPMYVIKNKVNIVRVNPITNKETTLSSAGEVAEGGPEFYSVSIDQHPDDQTSMVVDFTILKVRYEDDGMYRCKVFPGDKSDSTETGYADREVVVHRPLSSLKLIMGDFDPLEQSPADPLYIDHGEYKVSCVAEGSNPATEDVHLTFHGLMLNHSEPEVTAMEGDMRKFRTTVNGNLKIMVSNDNQDLVCQAKDSTGKSMSVKLTVKVNIYDPDVSCNDSSAYVGEANPMLYCTVNYTGMEVTSFAYQIGDTAEIVKEGDNHPKNIAVTVSQVAPSIAVVALDLHKAEHEYLDRNYYILIDLEGGHTSKVPVRLSKKEAPASISVPGTQSGNNPNDPGDSGNRISSSVVIFLMLFVTTFWSFFEVLTIRRRINQSSSQEILDILLNNFPFR